MKPDDSQFDEYSLPGDEPMKHQWDTNVQFDWLRHQPEDVQKSLPKDPGQAWDKHQENLHLEHMYEKEINEPLHESLQPKGKVVPLPGKSLRTYYSKKKKK